MVGWAQRADGNQHAFVWSPVNGMTDLGWFGGQYASAQAIRGGHITGQAEIASLGQTHAFISYTGGIIISIGTFGGTQAWWANINKNEEIVGSSQTAGKTIGNIRAVSWLA